jgi:hypothetical protein
VGVLVVAALVNVAQRMAAVGFEASSSQAASFVVAAGAGQPRAFVEAAAGESSQVATSVEAAAGESSQVATSVEAAAGESSQAAAFVEAAAGESSQAAASVEAAAGESSQAASVEAAAWEAAASVEAAAAPYKGGAAMAAAAECIGANGRKGQSADHEHSRKRSFDRCTHDNLSFLITNSAAALDKTDPATELIKIWPIK